MIRSKRECLYPHCGKLVDKGYCEQHKPKTDDSYRASARQRGYDTNWEKFREQYLRKNPICTQCGALATIVHHVKPLSSGGDKYRSVNLQAVCVACHNRIHNVARGGRYHGR